MDIFSFSFFYCNKVSVFDFVAESNIHLSAVVNSLQHPDTRMSAPDMFVLFIVINTPWLS